MHLPESLQDLADSETVRFLRRPKSISRICGGVFSLVIFSSLLTDGYQNRTENPQLRCVLNSNHVACSFAVEAGFLSFLSCLIFLALDARESRITGSRFKTAFQLLDFILAVLWAGVWFVAFCFLASQWQHSKSKHFLLGNSSAKAAIAFAFFSVPVWIFQAYLAFQDLRDEAPVPYKRSLDEGGVVLNTLSPSSTISPVNPPTTGPNSVSYTSSALSPYLTAPKGPRLAMMPDS
ncbi:synaptogyrin-4 isoform X1 [Peromyscus leucopus]|uniref:synaptogyrin-4 isoform X1 n=1 Tax=Peromyscus leucopus TaxID=10041 RepID=UPI0010A1C1DE|nr:synaptogyrin-4 isoform X1 [Peromyscus leucopus]XP_037055814.1 synaptogyrin-4 isoform X1 [Peromyscus leucopus]XP_037055823.1 synaptogyrin-4 isoform X1 [Peromyscus leucopus]